MFGGIEYLPSLRLRDLPLNLSCVLGPEARRENVQRFFSSSPPLIDNFKCALSVCLPMLHWSVVETDEKVGHSNKKITHCHHFTRGYTINVRVQGTIPFLNELLSHHLMAHR